MIENKTHPVYRCVLIMFKILCISYLFFGHTDKNDIGKENIIMKCRVFRSEVKPKHQPKAKKRYQTCTKCWRLDREFARDAKRLLG